MQAPEGNRPYLTVRRKKSGRLPLRLRLSGDEVGHPWDGVGDLSVFGGVDEAFLEEAVPDRPDAGGGLSESGGDLAGLAGAFAVWGHGLQVGALGWCGSFPS